MSAGPTGAAPTGARPARAPRRPTAADGVVVVDKPAGWTSHDVVARMRRIAGTRKVGHAGTLDPMATGVLVVGVGRATRLLTYVVGADKEYLATVRLGETTTRTSTSSTPTPSTVAARVASTSNACTTTGRAASSTSSPARTRAYAR